jgi:hypothetical protein
MDAYAMPMLSVAEGARLSALRSYEVLDTPPEAALDGLAAAAAGVCGAPVALVSLVDRDRQFFKARFGSALVQTPRDGSFCSHAIQQNSPLVVSDARSDLRFNRHPMVLNDPHIRFYAGARLITSDGAPIGTLCVLDWVPRSIDDRQTRILELLADQVVAMLERRKADLTRQRVRKALHEDLKERLIELSRVGAAMQDDRGLAVFGGAEAALQVVDDCIDVLAPPAAAALQRRPVDLAHLCQSLVEALQEPHTAAPLFSATGDCRGHWDPDRIAQALSAILEDVLSGGPEPRIEARGHETTVALYMNRPRIGARSPLLALRLDLARALIQAHGGSMDERPRGSGVTLVVTLPRQP